MRDRGWARFFILATAAALVCFGFACTALAASQLPNDNHTDTADYCMRAHDVAIGLSEVQSMPRETLEAEIASQSSFVFLIRDNSRPYADWTRITSGYTADFSALAAVASAEGYPVTVTLQRITPGLPSQITFRVYVADDSSTPPPTYQVAYRFASGTEGRDLPDAVRALQPEDTTGKAGDSFTPAPVFDAVAENGGTWRFAGWDEPSQTVSDHDLLFTGTWVWEANALPVLPALPECTPTPTPTPTLAPTPEPVPAKAPAHRVTPGPSATLTPEAALAPVSNTRTPRASTAPSAPAEPPGPQVRQGGGETAGSSGEATPVGARAGGMAGYAAMAIAVGLGGVLTAQMAGIASDVRVLKWYEAKKAKYGRAE